MKKLLLAVAVFFFINSLPAQIVNTESARMQSDTVGWMGGAGLAMSLTQNTTKIFGMEAETHLQYKTKNDKGLWLILGNYNYLKVGKTANISNYFMHLRYNRKINDWLRWEAFTQYQTNYVMQIDSRLLLGTGPRFKLIKRKIFKLYLGILFMYEHEKERTNPVVLHNDIRNSSYLSFSWLPHPNMELISTTYIQPRLDKFSDYRLLNQAVFKVKATPHFAMSVKWNYLHDRFPAGVAPRTPYTFGTGLDYDF